MKFQNLFILFLSLFLAGFSGCDTVDTQVGVPEGRNSSNDRYQDDDIIAPQLRFHLKQPPPPPEAADDSGQD